MKKNVLLVILILSALGLTACSTSIKDKAADLISNDLAKDVTITNCYYNKEKNQCYAYFYRDGFEDIAFIDFETNAIGYESVFTEMAENVKRTSTGEESKRLAQNAADYAYNAISLYSALQNSDGWEQVYPE